MEQGIYSTETFLTRTRTIAARREKIAAQADELRQEMDRLIRLQASRTDLIPQLEHVLDVYWSSSVQERNELLKTVLEKVEYRKTRRERWKGGGDMTLTLFPRLPV